MQGAAAWEAKQSAVKFGLSQDEAKQAFKQPVRINLKFS